jgi:putative membrane protein insertion efficiency factor
MTRLVLIGLRFYYRVLSIDHGWLGKLLPHRGRVCRFEPSCSEYALQAVECYGAGQGLWLAAKRVSRCHPWGGFGYDPLPKQQEVTVN